MAEHLLARCLPHRVGMFVRTGKVRNIFLFTMTLACSVVPRVASARAVTRIEQNDSHIIYSGNWYSNDSANHSGGTAALTNAKGARVTLTFTGSGIRWIGVRDGYAGLGTVMLD